MNERQIRKLKNKFILISTLSFFGVMLLMGGMIYAFSEMTLRNEVRQIMEYIAENEGELPSEAGEAEAQTGGNQPAAEESRQDGNDPVAAESRAEAVAARGDATDPKNAGPEDFNARMEWSLRRIFGTDILEDSSDYIRNTSYFAVLFTPDDEVEKITFANISRIDEARAEQFARVALRRMFDFGSFGRFYYYTAARPAGGSIVIYVDRTGQVYVNNRILFAVLTLLGFGTILAFFFMRILSRRVLKNEIENAEKQKQFITNASHELKTPLAVIRANTEMQEMLEGGTEWTASTMRQVDRMSGLIGNLVKIARAQESAAAEFAELDVGQIVSETADSFAAVAQGEGKTLEKQVEEPVKLITDEGLLRQLATLLIDNAVKYCDEGGTVTVALKKSGKAADLRVSNSYAEGKDIDYRRFFDRFYRKDESHNAEKGGFGIGLSIAESIVKTLKGTIDVSWKNGIITFRVLLRP